MKTKEKQILDGIVERNDQSINSLDNPVENTESVLSSQSQTGLAASSIIDMMAIQYNEDLEKYEIDSPSSLGASLMHLHENGFVVSRTENGLLASKGEQNFEIEVPAEVSKDFQEYGQQYIKEESELKELVSQAPKKGPISSILENKINAKIATMAAISVTLTGCNGLNNIGELLWGAIYKMDYLFLAAAGCYFIYNNAGSILGELQKIMPNLFNRGSLGESLDAMLLTLENAENAALTENQNRNNENIVAGETHAQNQEDYAQFLQQQDLYNDYLERRRLYETYLQEHETWEQGPQTTPPPDLVDEPEELDQPENIAQPPNQALVRAMLPTFISNPNEISLPRQLRNRLETEMNTSDRSLLDSIKDKTGVDNKKIEKIVRRLDANAKVLSQMIDPENRREFNLDEFNQIKDLFRQDLILLGNQATEIELKSKGEWLASNVGCLSYTTIAFIAWLILSRLIAGPVIDIATGYDPSPNAQKAPKITGGNNDINEDELEWEEVESNDNNQGNANTKTQSTENKEEIEKKRKELEEREKLRRERMEESEDL